MSISGRGFDSTCASSTASSLNPRAEAPPGKLPAGYPDEPSEGQRVRRPPPNGSGTASRRTPFCAFPKNFIALRSRGHPGAGSAGGCYWIFGRGGVRFRQAVFDLRCWPLLSNFRIEFQILGPDLRPL
jgi:hypothetical protein